MNEQLNKKIHCSICSKLYTNLSGHLKAHKISPSDYRKKHGETSYKRYVIQKINKLFIRRRSRWTIGYWYTNESGDSSWSYRTNDKDNIKEKNHFYDRNLKDVDIAGHLNFKYVIGILPQKGKTHFLCFDIDGKTSTPCEDAKKVTLLLIADLTNYFDKKDIHVVFSGGKGYHIWLIFKKEISIETLLNFAKYITAWNNNNTEVNIEFRPESNNGKTIKLPLGKHLDTLNFCPFVDTTTLEPVPNSYEYLMSIQETSLIDFSQFIIPSQNNTEFIPSKISHKIPATYDSVNEIYQNGLPNLGMRNEATYLIAILLKDKYNYTQDEAIQRLADWTQGEYNANRTKDDAEKSKYDIISTVKNVYKNDHKLLDSIELTPFEKSLIPLASFHLPKKTFREKEYAKRLETCYYHILKLGKMWNKKGYFFISKKYLCLQMNCDKSTINRYIKKLTSNSLLFEAVKGLDKKKYYEKLKEAAAPHMHIKTFNEFFINQPKPNKGYNSLFYLPIFDKPKKQKEYIRCLEISPSLKTMNAIRLFNCAKFIVSSYRMHDTFFFHNIIFKEKTTKKILQEYRRYRKIALNILTANKNEEFVFFKKLVLITTHALQSTQTNPFE